MAFLFFAAFLLVPLIEIALYIQVGGMIGLWPTLGLTLLTAIVGSALVRLQGIGVLNEARASIERAEPPVDALIHGVGLVMAGAFLITPGFFTDTMGILLLVPGIRLAIGHRLMRGIKPVVIVRDDLRGGPRRGPPGGTPPIIEGSAEEIDPESPWRDR